MSVFSESPPTNEKDVEAVENVSKREDQPSEAVKKLYRVIQHRTGAVGGYGHHGALYGEITMGSFQKIVNFMKEHTRFGTDSLFIDIGSGLGKPNLHVLLDPAVKQSFGVELEHLRWQLSLHNLTHVLAEVEELQPLAAKPTIFFARNDITLIDSFDPFTHLYTFDIGFPPNALRAMSQAFNNSTSALVFACFHKPKDIIRDYGFKADLCGSLSTRMHGSNEGHKVYFYRHLANYRRLHPQDLIDHPAVEVNLYPNRHQTKVSDFMTVEKLVTSKAKKLVDDAENKPPLKIIEVVNAQPKKTVVNAAANVEEKKPMVATRASKRIAAAAAATATSIPAPGPINVVIEPRTPTKGKRKPLTAPPSTGGKPKRDDSDVVEVSSSRPSPAPKNLFEVKKGDNDDEVKIIENPAKPIPQKKIARMFEDGFTVLNAHQKGDYRAWIDSQLGEHLFTSSRSRRQSPHRPKLSTTERF